MKKYTILVCETRIITTDMEIEVEANIQAEAENSVMFCLESPLLRDDVIADEVITEDLREYEIVSFDDVDDDNDQFTLPEIVIEKVQEMPAARR